MRGVVLDAVPLELAATTPRLLEERRVAADGEELLHLVVEELVVLARRPALEEERLAAELLDLVGVVGRGRAPQRRRPVWKSKFYGAFALKRRVVLHAIDATPARRRGGAGSSPLDGARAAVSSPRDDLVKNCRVHPTHWLISTLRAHGVVELEVVDGRPFGAVVVGEAPHVVVGLAPRVHRC